MPKKSESHGNKKESHSMNKGAQNKGQGRGSGKTGEHWQQGKKEGSVKTGDNWQKEPQKGSGSANENWRQGPNNDSGNANGNFDQMPDMGALTQAGCLPTLWARIKNAFKPRTSGGCLSKLFILILPLLAVGAILLITL